MVQQTVRNSGLWPDPILRPSLRRHCLFGQSKARDELHHREQHLAVNAAAVQ
jgi:hypothetical protein